MIHPEDIIGVTIHTTLVVHKCGEQVFSDGISVTFVKGRRTITIKLSSDDATAVLNVLSSIINADEDAKTV